MAGSNKSPEGTAGAVDTPVDAMKQVRLLAASGYPVVPWSVQNTMTLRKIPSLALAIMLYGMLSACAGAPLPSADNGAARAVAVPGDDGVLVERLRASLRERGWALMSYDAAALERSRAYDSLARQAKYRLTLSEDRIGNCRGGTPSYLYNAAMIENLSGDVVFALTGANCLDTVISRFADGLDRNDLIVPRIGAGG
ncbi:hypothetical protein T5B8_13740 [Salinisphaera sp. T5B8]|uniref:hypothetical protein n=1 Tax=Salinisphaera sp. T5B8 TaxID=1304154 RepID=UPI0033402124